MTYTNFIKQNKLHKMSIEELKLCFINEVDKKDYSKSDLNELVEYIYNSFKHT